MSARPVHRAMKWLAVGLWAAAGVIAAAAIDSPVSRAAARIHGSTWRYLGETISAAAQVEVPFALLAALAIAAAAWRKPALLRLVLRGALVLVLSAVLTQALKSAIGRSRPNIEFTEDGVAVGKREGSSRSMPSGHTLTAFALAGVLSVGVGRWRWVLYGWAGLVGVSRVMVGAHWASDVAVGAVLGLALGWFSRRFPRQAGLRLGQRIVALARAGGRRARLMDAAALTVLALPLFLAANNQIPLIDRDEPRFAQCAREMIERGDFVVPHFGGRIRFEKPPLSYWAICGAYGVLGQTEFSARLPSASFGVAAVLLTYAIGLRLFGRRVAFIGALVLVSSLQMVIEAKAATADAALLALTLGAFYGALRLRDGGRPALWVPVLYVCLGLSNLAKGPVGLGVVGLALAALLIVRRDRRFLRRLHVLVGLLIVAAVNAPWLILVQVRTQGAFLQRIITDHLFAHTVRGKEGHGGIFLVYVPLVAGLFFPWSVLLPRALGRAWRERKDDPARWFLLCWVLPGLALFCAIGTKLPHYLLPLYPALSLLVAKSVNGDVEANRNPLSGRWGRIGAGAMILGAVGIAIGLPAVVKSSGFPLFPVLCAAFLGLLLTAGVIGAIWLMARRSVLPALAALLAAAYISWVGIFHLVLPPVTEYSLAEMVAPALESCRRQGLPVAAMGCKEPSLVWRMRGLLIIESGDDLARFAQQHAAGACLIRMSDYRIARGDKRLTLVPLSYHRGFNFAKWRWEDACLAEVFPRG